MMVREYKEGLETTASPSPTWATVRKGAMWGGLFGSDVIHLVVVVVGVFSEPHIGRSGAGDPRRPSSSKTIESLFSDDC